MAISSSSPVFMFLFTIFSSRLASTPFTAMTYSLRMVSAFSNTSLGSSLSLKVTCMVPVRSRRPMNMREPRLRHVPAQPMSTISLPTSSTVGSAQ